MKVYAFIDNQNLNLGIQSLGWKMDWRQLRQYLKKKYNVVEAYMFIGYMQEHEAMYKQMYNFGFNVILKPTVGMFTKEEDRSFTKGNVDVELVLQVMLEWPNYDRAIVISGDGDFYSLIDHLVKEKKLLKLMVPTKRYSSLLTSFDPWIVRLDELRKELAYKDHTPPKKILFRLR